MNAVIRTERNRLAKLIEAEFNTMEVLEKESKRHIDALLGKHKNRMNEETRKVLALELTKSERVLESIAESKARALLHLTGTEGAE